MSDKILKIKLEVDTTATGKFTKVSQEIEKSLQKTETLTDKLKSLDSERLVLIAKQEAAYAKSFNAINNINSKIEQGVLNQRLAFNAANTSALALDRTLKTIQTTLNENSRISAGLKFSSGKSEAPRSLTASTNIAEEGTRRRNPLTGASIELESERAEKIAKMQEAVSRTTNSILEQQTRDRLAREEAAVRESARKAAQAKINATSFADRLNSVPRVGSQGSQIDITGTLSRYLKDQANAARLAAEAHKKLNDALDKGIEKQKSLVTRIIEAVSIYRIYSTAINLAEQSLLNIPQAGIQENANKAGIFAIFGSEAGKDNIKFIQDLAKNAGQVITDLETSYAKFAPSARLANATQAEINQTFKDFTETATVLNLTKDKVDSIFLALDQIYSKGVVQSEEIKKQLGNALPGAVEIGALAMKKSPADFLAAMKRNEITAKEFVPKFAALYREIFGGVDDSVFKDNSTKLLSNLNRIQTSYINFNRAVYQDINGFLNEVVKLGANVIDTLTANLKGLQDAIKLTADLIIFRLGIGALAGTSSAFTLAAKAVNSLTLALVGLSAPATALVALWGFAITRLANLKLGYDSVLGVTVELAGESVSLADTLENTVIVNFEKLIALLETLKDSYKNAFGDTTGIAERQARAIEAQKNALQAGANPAEVVAAYNKVLQEELPGEKSFNTRYEENLAKIAKGSTNIVTRTIADQRQAVIDSFKDKSILEIQAAFAQGVLRNNEELTKALTANNFIQAPASTQPYGDSEESKEAKLAKIKEVNFNKELSYQDALTKQEEQRFKAKLETLNLQKQSLEFQLKQNSLNSTPVADKFIQDKITQVENQTIALQQKHEQALLAIAKGSENIIVGSVKKTVLSAQQAFKAIQDIESGGVKTRGGREGAVSITGALGKSQVQPSTLNDFTGNVPSDILAIEKKAKFNLNVLKKKVTLEPSEIERLRDYALANVDSINGVGEKLFTSLVQKFEGDFVKAAVAYNTGAKRVEIASAKAKDAGREDFESFLPTSGKFGLNPRALQEAQGYARKSRAAIGGDSFEPALLEQQTKQQEASDKIRNLEQEKYLIAQQRQLDIAEAIKKVKEEEVKLGIELLESSGNVKQAEIAKVKAEFAERYANAERLGSDFLKLRLPIIEKEKLNRIELNDLQKKYAENDRVFNQQVQELTNKSLVGKLSNLQSAQAIVDLQNTHIVQQKAILENELRIARSAEDREGIQTRLNALKQKEVEIASFNSNFLAIPEVQKFENNSVNISASASKGLELLNQENEAKLISFQAYQERKAQIEEQFNTASRVNLETHLAATANMLAGNFGTITQGAIAAFGEQSTAARAAFALQKAFLAAQAVMEAEKAALSAYAFGNSIGGPVLGSIFSGISYAATAVKVASIVSQPMPSATGIAHGGLENVPKESTYLLDKGERVLSPKQNVDITKKVSNIHDKVNSNSSPSKQAQNIRIINVMDENLVYNALESDQAEQIIMNVVRRNK